jgi:acylphosphatase
MVSGDPIKRMHVLFSGRVQGVGFRYTVCHIAAELEVTGFVRNLWDGDVELVAEGRQQDLTRLLNDVIGSRLGRYVSRNSVRWDEATGEFDRFGVKF